MSRERTLIKNTTLYMVGNFISKFLGFLLLPFYTHYLSTDNFGYFDIINTTIILFLPLVTFEINDGLYRYLQDSKTSEETADIIMATLSSTLRNLLVFSLIFIIITSLIPIKYSYLILPALISLVLSDTWQQIARGLRQNVLYSVSGVTYTFVMLGFNIILVVLCHMKVDALLYSNIAAGFSSFIIIEVKLRIFKRLSLSRSLKDLRKSLIKFSLPLMPNAMNWWIINLSSRYLIFCYIGSDANGIYAVANKFPSILILINTVFNLAWQESAIAEYSSEDKDSFYSKMFNLYMRVQLSLMLVLIPFTKILMGFMVDPAYFVAWKYTPLLYISTIFSSFSTFYGTGYLVSKETKGALTTSIVSIIVNIGLAILLIPLLGLQAAAFANAFAFLVMWIIRYVQIKQYFRIDVDFRVFFSLCFAILAFIGLYFINNSLVCYLLTAVGTIIFFAINHDMVKKLVHITTFRIKSFSFGK